VQISIFDSAGRLIKILDLGKVNAGYYFTPESAARWDGKDRHGNQVGSGVYFYSIQAGEYISTRKMILR